MNIASGFIRVNKIIILMNIGSKLHIEIKNKIVNVCIYNLLRGYVHLSFFSSCKRIAAKVYTIGQTIVSKGLFVAKYLFLGP